MKIRGSAWFIILKATPGDGGGLSAENQEVQCTLWQEGHIEETKPTAWQDPFSTFNCSSTLDLANPLMEKALMI